MNKAIIVGLVVALVISLAGMGFLAYQYSNHTASILQLDEDLKQAKGDLSQAEQELGQTKGQLSKTEGELSRVKADLASSQAELDKRQHSIDKLRDDNRTLSRDLADIQAMNCGRRIFESEIRSVSTNQGLVELITRAVESNYRFSSINTTFDLVWNNSKTAVFDIQDQDRGTVKVVVSWNSTTNRVTGIYDVNGACFYYAD